MPLPTVYPDEKLAVLQRKMKLRPPCHVWELFWSLLQEFSSRYLDQQEKNWSTVIDRESTWLCGFCLNAFYSHVSFIESQNGQFYYCSTDIQRELQQVCLFQLWLCKTAPCWQSKHQRSRNTGFSHVSQWKVSHQVYSFTVPKPAWSYLFKVLGARLCICLPFSCYLQQPGTA